MNKTQLMREANLRRRNRSSFPRQNEYPWSARPIFDDFEQYLDGYVQTDVLAPEVVVGDGVFRATRPRVLMPSPIAHFSTTELLAASDFQEYLWSGTIAGGSVVINAVALPFFVTGFVVTLNRNVGDAGITQVSAQLDVPVLSGRPVAHTVTWGPHNLDFYGSVSVYYPPVSDWRGKRRLMYGNHDGTATLTVTGPDDTQVELRMLDYEGTPDVWEAMFGAHKQKANAKKYLNLLRAMQKTGESDGGTVVKPITENP